jgi:hypothetical protein
MSLSISEVTSNIQLALAPVFLLTAVVTLNMGIANRLSRLLDRMRFIHNELYFSQLISERLRRHYRVEYRECKLRGKLCTVAIIFDVLSGVLISLTVLELFFFQAAYLHHLEPGYVVCTFVSGLLCFAASLLFVLIEVVCSVYSAGWNLPIDPQVKD